MYYEEGLTQADISQSVGVTRSAVSRMLTEARQKGIVNIRVNRPMRYDKELEIDLAKRFKLQRVCVLVWGEQGGYKELRERLGKAGGQVLREILAPDTIIGVAWGTTVSATIDALEIDDPVPVKVVQLVGVLGSSSHAYNAHVLVEHLARKTGGEGIYLYTPFIVENADTARSLLNTQQVRDALVIGKKCDVALLGIGTTDPEYSSLFKGGHLSKEMLEKLTKQGAVGDVSAQHFDIQGNLTDTDFHERLVGIALDDLLAIPMRIGVAGNRAKASAIVGALRGGYVNVLITDNGTAQEILEIDSQGGGTE
jgi:DNA-binding transcriptional regulator LsrR (DeoR family)